MVTKGSLIIFHLHILASSRRRLIVLHLHILAFRQVRLIIFHPLIVTFNGLRLGLHSDIVLVLLSFDRDSACAPIGPPARDGGVLSPTGLQGVLKEPSTRERKLGLRQ